MAKIKKKQITRWVILNTEVDAAVDSEHFGHLKDDKPRHESDVEADFGHDPAVLPEWVTSKKQRTR